MRVVNCRLEPYTHYIGRGSICGNPFTHLPLTRTKAIVQVASLEEAIQCFAQWYDGDPKWAHVEPQRRLNMLEFVKTLKDEDVLGCFCKPQHACHGDILVDRWKRL